MRRLDPDAILWTEGMNDAFGQYMDYYMDKNPLWMPMRIHPECETFVEMWRYTLPDYIVVNDPRSYSYPPSKDPIYGVNYAFVLGIRGIFPSPERGLERAAERKASDIARRLVVEKIEQLWIKGGEYLFHGWYMDDIGLKLSDPAVLAKVYRSTTGIAVPVWNTKSEPVTIDMSIDLDVLCKQTGGKLLAWSLDADVQLAQQESNGVVQVTLSLPAHGVDVILFKGK